MITADTAPKYPVYTHLGHVGFAATEFGARRVALRALCPLRRWESLVVHRSAATDTLPDRWTVSTVHGASR